MNNQLTITDCTLEICKELDKWLTCDSVVKNAMFDSTFTKEFEYYQQGGFDYKEKIKDQTKVVFIDNVLIAYMVVQYYEYDNIKEVSFNPIVINPKYHGQGFGKKILTNVIEQIEEIVGGKVNKFNVAIYEKHEISKKLFTSLGFEKVGSSEDKEYLYYSLDV